MTEYLTPAVRNQIEGHLGRELRSDELVTVTSVDDLNDAETAVLETLARRHRLAALLYLRSVVDGITGNAALGLIDRVLEEMRIADEQRALEGFLGRSFTASELLPAASLDAITDEQLVVVRQLYSLIPSAAKRYVALIVPSATSNEIVPFLARIH